METKTTTMDTAIMMPNRIESGTQSLWNGGPLTAIELGLCFCSGRSRGTFGLDKELKLRTIFAIQRLNGLALEICGLIFVLERILLFFLFGTTLCTYARGKYFYLCILVMSPLCMQYNNGELKFRTLISCIIACFISVKILKNICSLESISNLLQNLSNRDFLAQFI